MQNHQYLEIGAQKFWEELAPDFHICDSAFFSAIPLLKPSDEEGAYINELLVHEGYFQSKANWNVDCARMAALARKLSDNNIFPVFAFIYDEFWLPFMQLHEVYAAILGDAYYVLPDFWIWNVDPQKGESGWRAHRDKNRNALLSNGAPKTLTTWIPLSEATPLNGCMYVVPAMLDPTYNTENEQLRQFEYSSIRALPAKPGDFFMWNQAVLHWGGQSSPRAQESRVSMAFEFQRADVEPFNTPLLKPLTILSFEDRLKLIAKQILQYQHMYPLGEELKAAAEMMISS